MTDLLELLSGNPYPGRGIVVGKDRVYYFIMGRSGNSRNRVFTLTEDGIQTQAHDPSKLEDPSLIIYHPVRRIDGALIVTNGDQTDTVAEFIRDTIRDFMVRGETPEQALATREYEPDHPNYTPRISAVIYDNGAFQLSILKHGDGRCRRQFFNYEGCEEGKGYFISTYQGDGNPLPSFAGEPVEVSMPQAEQVWAALNADNKVSLYANVGGKVTLFNKNLGD